MRYPGIVLASVCTVGIGLFLLYSNKADDVHEGALAATIRWTSYGIPHIKAADELGLGYGIGYAYARDNACLLVNEMITARGERSLHFGQHGESSDSLNNLSSDFFFTWLNTATAVETFWNAQAVAIQQLMTGYVAGFNRYLSEAEASSSSCLDEQWLQPITRDDLIRLTRRLLVEGGVGQFAQSIVAATPPEVEKPQDEAIEVVATLDHKGMNPMPGEWRDEPRLELGSNAVAIGRKRTANGKGILLANPHFPWHGALRFYQMHLTIPGKLDVMGAALPGLPIINIGFNQHVAWTHTVDTSHHFTVYRLELDPNDATHYLVDGQSYPLQKKALEINVRNENGDLSTESHTVYESRFGPVIVWPGMLEWNEREAYALRGANLENTRVLQQWYVVNRAEDALAVFASVMDIQGMPWVNTIAADDLGNALYMNHSVVPLLPTDQDKRCVIPALMEKGLPGLEGNSRACEWHFDSTAAQPGIVPAAQLPSLLRDDFVQNSNDSAWMTNPLNPIEGYSAMVSRDGRELGLRARFALSRLQGNEQLTASYLKNMLTDNQVYLSDLVMDDLLTLCSQSLESGSSDDALHRACLNLNTWDGQANLDSGLGLVYFQVFMKHFDELNNAWRIPFDKKNPVETPRGIALNHADVVKGIKQALIEADRQIEKWGLGDNVSWGDIQVSTRGGKHIGIPGADGRLGVYNAIRNQSQGELKEVVRGSSYIQLVGFTEDGPEARGLLTFSQSSDPVSPHYSDQTRLFSRQHWPMLPFTEAQIEADPALERMELREH